MALAQDAAAVSGDLSGGEARPGNRGRDTPAGDGAMNERETGEQALSPLGSAPPQPTSVDRFITTRPPQWAGAEARSMEPTKDDLGEPHAGNARTTADNAATKTSASSAATDATKTTANSAATYATKTTASSAITEPTKTTASSAVTDATKTSASSAVTDSTKTSASSAATDATKTSASSAVTDATKTSASSAVNDATKTSASSAVNDATTTSASSVVTNATKTTADSANNTTTLSSAATKTNVGNKTVDTTKTTLSKPPAEPTQTALDKELEALLSLGLVDPSPHDVLMIQSEPNGTMNIVKADASLEDPSMMEGKGPPPPLRPATTWTSANLREFKHRMANEKHGLLTVRRGEVVTVRVPTHPDGKRLCWEFATDDYDIGFGIFFDWTPVTSTAVTLQVSESSDEEEEEDTESPWHGREGDVERGSVYRLRSRYGEIMQVYRRDSHREVQAGSHEYPGEGVYLLKLDNSYSLLRSKTLYFHVYYSG